MEVTVLDDDTGKIGRKLIVAEHRDRFLSKWIDRLPATEIFPPLGSAISVKGGNDRCARPHCQGISRVAHVQRQ